MRALVFDRLGDPDVLHLRELPAPIRAPGSALVRLQAIGVNFADVYRRRGDYHLDGQPPWILGYEGAGIIEEIDRHDAEATGLTVGARVGFADVPRANAECVAAPVTHLVPLPDAISADTAAAALLQGLTAQYLTRDSHPVGPGRSVLVHAAAGGVGLLLVQIARILGARVLAAVSSAEKQAVAEAAGAETTVRYDEDWVEAARRFSPGGVDVVYDSVGTTLDDSLRAARTGGHVVFYGMAGGNPKPVDPRRLMDESKSLTGGDLWNVLTSRDQRVQRADQLFQWIASGQLTVRIAQTFSLAEGAAAHAFLESRRAIGKVLIVP